MTGAMTVVGADGADGALNATTATASTPASTPATTPASAPASVPASAPASAPALSSKPLRQVAVLGDTAFRHGGTVTAVKPLADGKRLLSCGWDGTTRLWDLASGRQLACYEHENYYVWDAAVLPDGKRFLTATDKAVMLWELEPARRLAVFPFGALVFRVGLGDTGEVFAAGDQEGNCAVWRIADRTKLADLPHGKGAIYTAILDGNDRRVITGGGDSAIRGWAVEANAVPRFLKAMDRKEDAAAAQGRGGKLAQLVKAVVKNPRNDASKTGDIFTLTPSPDRSRIVVCCEARGPWLMDARTGKEIWRAARESPKAKDVAGAAAGPAAATSPVTATGPASDANATVAAVADANTPAVAEGPEAKVTMTMGRAGRGALTRPPGLPTATPSSWWRRMARWLCGQQPTGR